MKHMRKAVLAGLGATGTALIVGVKTEIPQTQDGWFALIGGALLAGLMTGYATYKVRNEPVSQPSAYRSGSGPL